MEKSLYGITVKNNPTQSLPSRLPPPLRLNPLINPPITPPIAAIVTPLITPCRLDPHVRQYEGQLRRHLHAPGEEGGRGGGAGERKERDTQRRKGVKSVPK